MEPVIARQVGETMVRFEFDMNHRTRHWQRIHDFFAGMGVKPETSCFDLIWYMQMTQQQKARFDAWLSEIDATQPAPAVVETIINLRRT